MYKSNFKIPVSLNSYAQNTHTYIHIQLLPLSVKDALLLSPMKRGRQVSVSCVTFLWAGKQGTARRPT